MNDLERRLAKLEAARASSIPSFSAVYIGSAGEDTEANSAAMLTRFRAEHGLSDAAVFPVIIVTIGSEGHCNE